MQSISPVPPITIGSSGDTCPQYTQSNPVEKSASSTYLEEARVAEIIVGQKGENEREEEK